MKKVAIVGFAESSRAFAPFDEESVEIWGMNALYRPGFLRRATRWFEIHNRALIETELMSRRPSGYLDWLGAFPGPVYMQQAWPDLSSSVRYPLEEVIRLVGPYLTSTVSMMVGLAILEGFGEIQLFGVDMAVEDYANQRAGCEYLLGFARARGVTVMIPEQSPLLNAPIYGYGNLNPEGEHITDAQYAARLDKLQTLRDTMAKDLALLDGRLQETRYWIDATPEGARREIVRSLAYSGQYEIVGDIELTGAEAIEAERQIAQVEREMAAR